MLSWLSALLTAVTLLAAPTVGAPAYALVPRQSSCAQYATISSGPFTLQTNEWGAQYGQGSQCSTINGVNGNSIAWTTSWSWANNPNNVKSYSNVVGQFSSKPLNQYRSIQSTWNWK